jgi:hypothetical protein
MKTYAKGRQLENHALPTFSGGYNSYTAGKSTVDDKEFPYGYNVDLDDVGSAKKRAGTSRYGGEVASGKATTGVGVLKTASLDFLLVSAGTAVKYKNGSSWTALTGFTFTDNLQTDFCSAADRTYIANGTDALYYTDTGTTLTAQTNGKIGRYPVSYNARIYMTETAAPDRICYSNPYYYSYAGGTGAPSLTTTVFGSFDTDLTATTPKKNAGFIILKPGAGLVITGLFLDSTNGTDYLYAHTRNHGVWRIVPNATANSDGSISHTISQVSQVVGAQSGKSIVKAGNDQWLYGGDNIYTLGDVQNYINIRVSPQSGRVKSEVNSIATAGKSLVAGGFYKDSVYFSYRTGTYNDRILKYDTRLGSWSSPWIGVNAAWFYEYIESDGTRRFLAGSSNSSDSYVYELETGTNDNSTAIDAAFESKSTDCKRPGLTKRFAFIDVFYSMVFGTLTYEVFIDETSSITGSLQLGNSASRTVGIGSQTVGSFPVGRDYDTDTTFASLSQNDNFRIDCGYNPGRKVSVRFSNDNASEQFKINGMVIHYLPGSIYETSTTIIATSAPATYA